LTESIVSVASKTARTGMVPRVAMMTQFHNDCLIITGERQEAQLPQRYRGSAVITPFRVTQGHWFWYQLKTRMRLPISEYY